MLFALFVYWPVKKLHNAQKDISKSRRKKALVLRQCLPQSNSVRDKALIQPASTHFSIPVEDAEHEMFVGHSWDRSSPSLVIMPNKCPSDMFSKMNRFLWALVTQPKTSCTAVWLFSAVSRIKTGISAPMMNCLSLLFFKRELTKSFDY